MGEAISDPFVIDNTPPEVVVEAPNGGEIWNGERTITWRTLDAWPDEVNVAYTVNDGPPIHIAVGALDTGELVWDFSGAPEPPPIS